MMGEANFRTSFYHDGNRVLLNNESSSESQMPSPSAIFLKDWMGVAAKNGVELIPHVHVAAGGSHVST